MVESNMPDVAAEVWEKTDLNANGHEEMDKMKDNVPDTAEENKVY